MKRKIVRTIAKSFALFVALSATLQAHAQDDKALYQHIAPIDQYLMADRNAEVVFARTAAPDSISRDAEVWVLGRHGYEIAAKGKKRESGIADFSWMAPFDDPEFLHP